MPGRANALHAVASDGTKVRADVDGSGPPIIILNPGMDVSGWDKPAKLLARRFTVIRVARRQYRLDVPHPRHWTMSDEVADVAAVASELGQPAVLVGHSSGGVLALEAAVTAPALFAGLVVYEPPIAIDDTLGGEATKEVTRLVESGKPGRAMAVFLRDIVRVPGPLVWTAVLVSFYPPYRKLIPRQVDDLIAIDELGNRLRAYREIRSRVVLLGGDKSPLHLAHRMDALERVLPNFRRVTLRGQGHTANRRAPSSVAAVVEALAAEAFR